jgi:DNA-binding CsgD family transcriptional regulator
MTSKTQLSDKNKPQLSESEISVLTLIAKGSTAQEIAQKIGKSVHIVRDTRKSIYEKLNVNKNVQAVLKGIYHNLLQLEELIDDSITTHKPQ